MNSREGGKSREEAVVLTPDYEHIHRNQFHFQNVCSEGQTFLQRGEALNWRTENGDIVDCPYHGRIGFWLWL